MSTLEDAAGTDTSDNLLVSLGDSASTNSYNRLRVSESDTQIGITFSHTAHDAITKSLATGSGSKAYNSTIGCLRLTTTTSSADSIIVQSARYVLYNPGQSYNCYFSLNMGAAKTNVTKRVGIFDDKDGLFFEQTSSGLFIVIRTSSSGSPVDTRIAQSSWNLDKLDGTGSSQITLDITKVQLLNIDYVWQGVARYRFGFYINGKIIYCHQATQANSGTLPYTRAASRPLRVELVNTGTVASSTTMDVFCIVACRESNTELFVPSSYSASRITSKVIVGSASTLVPIISIRPALTYNSVVNRVMVIPTDFSLLTKQDNIYFAFYKGGTLTGASWSSVGGGSAVEVDKSATAITGGQLVLESYAVASSKSGGVRQHEFPEDAILGLNIAGTTADILTLVGLKLGGNSDTYASISWDEMK